MIPAEILKKVRLIEIKTRHIVNNIFGGEYHSAFKGMGMEFAEVREYYPGDDIRAIDWNVTARTGKPFIKKYDEERELTVMLIVDVSASGFFGTGESMKSDIMIELASIDSEVTFEPTKKNLNIKKKKRKAANESLSERVKSAKTRPIDVNIAEDD